MATEYEREGQGDGNDHTVKFGELKFGEFKFGETIENWDREAQASATVTED